MEVHDKSQIKAALRQSFGSVVYAVSEISDEDLVKPKAHGKWSPGEILGHLILSTKPVSKALSMPKLKLETTFGTNDRAERSFDELKERYYSLLNTGVQAPKTFIYNGVAEKGKEYLLNSFTKELNLLLSNIDEWNEKDLTKYILPHPAIGKLTIREMLFFTHFHTEHHQKQLITVEA